MSSPPPLTVAARVNGPSSGANSFDGLDQTNSILTLPHGFRSLNFLKLQNCDIFVLFYSHFGQVSSGA